MESITTWSSYTDEPVRAAWTDRNVLSLRSLARDDRGSALIEAAILVPVLIALFAGVFEFSWFFYQQHLVTLGLRDATSYLAHSLDPCDPTSRNWQREQERAKNLATNANVDAGKRARVRGWSPSMILVLCTQIDNPTDEKGLPAYRGSPVFVITTSTRFAYRSLGMLDVLRLRPPTIVASYSERALGY